MNEKWSKNEFIRNGRHDWWVRSCSSKTKCDAYLKGIIGNGWNGNGTVFNNFEDVFNIYNFTSIKPHGVVLTFEL